MDLICNKVNKCRACLLENNSELLCLTAQLVTANYENITYLECFQMCTRLEAYVDDQMPQMLCFQCATELRDAYEFIKKATQSHHTLLMKHEPLFTKTDEQVEAADFEWVPVQKTDDDNTVKTSTHEIPSAAVELTLNVDASIVKNYTSASSDNLACSPMSLKKYDSDHNHETNEGSGLCERDVTKKYRRQTKSNVKLLDKIDCSSTSPEENSSDSSYVPEEESVRRAKPRKKKKHTESKPKEIKLQLCHICPRTFKNVRSLKEHALTHEECRERNYTCEHCGRAFYNSRQCKRHYRTHDVNRQFKCKECDKTFRHESTLKTHMLTHTGGTLECKICGKVLLTKFSYRNHIKTHDINRKAFQCDQCERSFLNKRSLDLHTKIHTNGLFKCDQCDKLFLYRDSLNNHKQRHEGVTIVCEICGKGFPRKTELKSHMHYHSKETPYKCQYCDRAFSRAAVCNKHELQHEGFRYKCKICNKEYTNQASLIKHKLTHMGITMKCSICGKGFNCKFKMKRHIAGVHKIELEKTEDLIQKVKTKQEYPRTFTCAKNLKEHYETHEENRERNYTCEHCGKAFYNKRHRERHYKTHDVNQQFKCKECEKTYRHECSLKTHMLMHTGGTTECKICGKILLTKSSYRNHYKTHDINRKAFQCDQCERSFLNKKSIELHMQIHKDGIFRCDQCDKPFLYKDSLDSHMLRHAGVTIACKICGKGFPRIGELNSHMRVHSKETPYKCQYCDRAFSRVGVRNKHELQHEGFRYKCKICDKEYTNQPSFGKHKLTHMAMTMKCSICGKGFNDKFKIKRHIAGVHKIELDKTEELIQKVRTKQEYRGYIIDPP